jgi:hypothetical protein
MGGLSSGVIDALKALRESFRVKLTYIAEVGEIPEAGRLAAEMPHEMSDGPLGKLVGSFYVPPPKDRFTSDA